MSEDGYGRKPTRTASGEVRMRAQKVDARSPQAKAARLTGARYDAFGNLSGGTRTTTQTAYRPPAGETNIDKFKRGNLTPRLNAFDGTDDRPGGKNFMGPAPDKKPVVPVSDPPPKWADMTREQKLQASSNREEGNRKSWAGYTAFAGKQAQAITKGKAQAETRYAAFQAGMKDRPASSISEAGKLARSPEGSGLRYTAQTPFGTVGVRNGPAPVATAPPTRTAAMPPGGPNLNPLTPAPTPPASMARSGPATTMPTWAQSAPRSTRPAAAAPRGPAPAVAANKERLKAGDAVAKGMFGGLNEPFLPKVGRAAVAAGKTALGVAKAKTAFDIGLAKAAASGLRKFQRQGLIATAR